MAQYLSKEGADKLSSAIRAYIDSTHSTSLLKTQLGAANGVAPLGSDKLIPSSYLPSYVDDVIEVSNYASLPESGESGKIYVTIDDGKTYRWGGTSYAEISASLTIGTDASTAFAGDRGVKLEGYFINGVAKQAKKVTSSLTVGGKTYNGRSPIEIVKSDLGLGNVENTKLSTWAGTTNITTLGTITTGTWQGTTIAVNKGGTGLTSYTIGDMLYATGATTLAKVSSSSFGRSLLGATSGTKFAGLYAEKAEKDSQGNVITSTYMPFSGGTFTGDVTHNANMILANSKVIAGKDTSGSNISLLSLNASNQVVIGYGAHNKYDTLIYGNRIIAYGDICGQKGVSAKGIADFGIGSSSGGNGGAHYDLLIDQKTDRVTLQLKGDDGDIDTKDMLAFSTSRAGIVPKAPSAGSVLRGNGWGTLAFSELASRPTTLGGYGITDAYTKSQIENGVFPNMRVGLADDLGDIEETLDEEYTFQPTANPNEIRDGYAQIESLKGNSLVWNQMARSTSITNTVQDTMSICVQFQFTTNGASPEGGFLETYVPKVGEYFATIVIPPKNTLNGLRVKHNGAIRDINIMPTTSFIAGHKLYFSAHFVSIDTQTIGGLVVNNIQFIDLTQMFGEGYEPETVEEFERRCPKGMPMDYNEGEVIHFNGNIKSVGFNQWDEEWEVGGINTSNGKNNSETDKIRGKNFIRVTPSSEYYCKSPIASRIFFYDLNKNYISNGYLSANSSFTILDNAYYIRFRIASDYGTTYNNDICINLSDPDKNGTYEPYTEFMRDLPTELFEGGMKGRGTAYDEVYWDKAKRTNVKVQRFGKVDMGTLNWDMRKNDYGLTYFYISTGDIGGKSNCSYKICARYSYKAVSYKSIQEDKVIAENSLQAFGFVCIFDSSYTDTATFKAAMSGVMLYYELAEPIIEEIDIPYMDYQVSNDGTEEIVSDMPTTPIKARVTYNFDTVGTVKHNRFDISAIKTDLKSNYQPLATAINTSNIGSQSVASATKLQTPRTIWGQSFDGTGDVSGDLHLIASDIYWHSDKANYCIESVARTDASPYLKIAHYGGIEFHTGKLSRMYINSSGKVGIGTTDPQYKLDVNGSFKANSGIFKGKLGIDGGDSVDSILSLHNDVGQVIYNPSTKELSLFNGGTGYPSIKLKADTGAPIFRYNYVDNTLLHSGNTKLTLDAAYNWEDKNSQTNKQVYGFTLNVNGTEIGMSAITKEELEAILV